MKHEDGKTQHECERHEYMRKKRKIRMVNPAELHDKGFQI
jgi:hypothetical protein